MDCRKAWDLMMLRMDGSIRESEADKLDNHVAACSYCKGQWDMLKNADLELKTDQPLVPQALVKSVMSGICSIRRKEKMGMLPFIVSPAALLSAILALLLFNFTQAGPVAMINGTARAVSVLVKILQSIGAVAQYIIKVLYLQDAILVLSAALLTGAVAFAYRHFKRTSNSRMYWRV